MIKNGKFSIVLHAIKSYVVDAYKNRLTVAILIHTKTVIWFYGEFMIIHVKILVFCKNFMSTETFT